MTNVLLSRLRSKFDMFVRHGLHGFRSEPISFARGSHHGTATVRRSKKIGLLDHMGTGNLGDDETQTAVLQKIKERSPDAIICLFSWFPSDTEFRHRIPAYPIRREPHHRGADTKAKVKSKLSKHRIFLGVLKAIYAAIQVPETVLREFVFLVRSFVIIRTFDILIISGGGQLLDSWGGPWKYPYTIFKWVLLAKLSGVKCYFLNVGAGPLEHPLSKLFVKRALFLADYVSFRDKKSKALVHKIGYTGDAQVFPDCVYGLDVLPFSASRIARDKPIVGISPMAYCDPRKYYIRDQQAYESYLRKLTLFGSWLSQSYNVTLFSTDMWFDSPTLQELDAALRNETDMDDTCMLTHEPIKNTNDLLSQMSSMDFIITCRFHGVVFAHLMNIPLIAISHHPKVATLMSDLGLAEYCLDIDAFDLELLTATFTRMVTNKDSIKARLREKAALYNNALTTQFNQLFLSGGTK
jgi:polysaccharide pyruvyl transferase WcaK-like protein